MLSNYYTHHYPYELVFEFAQIFGTTNVEWMFRYSEDRVQRDLKISSANELHRQTVASTPSDGVHLVYGNSALVLDIDYDEDAPYRDGICACTHEQHLICDRCWLTVVGCVRMYVHMLKTYCGFVRVLCLFSGGRGVHIHVSDCEALELGDRMRLRICSDLYDCVRGMLKRLLDDPEELLRQALVGVATVDAQLRASEKLQQAFDANHECLCPAQQWPIEAYTAVLVPYFRMSWAPVLCDMPACNATTQQALLLVSTALQQGHQTKCDGATPACTDCRLIRLLSRMEQLGRGYATCQNDTELMQRIDVFLLLMRMFWISADLQVLHTRHPIRLPFSPHLRSGRMSVPIDIDVADTQPPSRMLTPAYVCAYTAALKEPKSLIKDAIRF